MQEKKYSSTHIGKIHTTNEGYEAVVVDGGTKRNYCTIEIERHIYEVSYDSLKKGGVKYPFHPTVHGKGYIGVGNYSNRTHKKLYSVWGSMLDRCYGNRECKKLPTYETATVCDEWLNLQTFAEWHESNYIEGYDLDKDLLVPGNKQYSSETCVFLPHKLNIFLTNVKSSNTSGSAGVHWNKKRKKWYAQISIEGKNSHLGSFNSVKEASKVYEKSRKMEVVRLQELYKDILPNSILNQIR